MVRSHPVYPLAYKGWRQQRDLNPRISGLQPDAFGHLAMLSFVQQPVALFVLLLAAHGRT